MTLKDIANEAGVSISTVSRVLNHPTKNAASPELCEKIRAIAAKGGYTPNIYARSLQSKTTAPSRAQHYIYILIAQPPQEVSGDPFYTTVITCIMQEAAKRNLHFSSTFSILDFLGDSFPSCLKIPLGSSLIIVGRFKSDLLTQLRKYFAHIVYVGLNRLDVDCDQVLCDCYEAVQDAYDYLYRLGHRRIAFLGAESEGRHRGFLRALEKRGISDKSLVHEIPLLSMDCGYQGVSSLLKSRNLPTALICANDVTAIGALQACKDMGFRVPDDISIMGIADIDTARFVIPKLTTIHAPLEEMGQLSILVLLSRLNGMHTIPLRLCVPYSLVERESCIAPAQPELL